MAPHQDTDTIKSESAFQAMRQILVAIFIVLSMMLMPWQGEYFVDEETSKSYSSAIGEDLDAWRIGDRWVYETLFDVQQLIANSGTDASLNTLTGDTQVEVTDIADLNYNGTQTLVYIVEVSGLYIRFEWCNIARSDRFS